MDSKSMLSPHIKENILKIRQNFIEYLQTPEGRSFEQERRSKAKTISNLLALENLSKFDEGALKELIDNLWSFNWWTNKEWLVEYFINGAGGISNITYALRELLYGTELLSHRIDKFRSIVKGIGGATITEILCSIFPKEYGIWNKKARDALTKLGYDDAKKYSISVIKGKQYEEINATLKEILPLIEDKKYLPDPDLLDVDHFLWYIVTNVEEEDTVSRPGGIVEDHDEIVKMLLEIGQGLGFETSAEVPITVGTKIDVLWRTRIGNLGEIKYAFEVQVKGSIDSLIINLMKAASEPEIHKVVAVAGKEQLEKIRQESQSLFPLLNKLVLWDVKEVTEAAELLEKLMNIMQRVRLTS